MNPPVKTDAEENGEAMPLLWEGMSVPTRDMDELHRILIEIMCDIRDVLDDENIPYYLVGGSAIGCMRDGRQVPWDDDIDVLVDANIFDDMELTLKRRLPDKYTVELANTVENHRSYCRVVREDTTLIRSPRIKCALGITVEIFPLVEIPDGGFARKLMLGAVRMYNLMNVGGDYVPRFLRRPLLWTKLTVRMIIDKLSTSCDCSTAAPLNPLFFDEIVSDEVFRFPSKMLLDGEEFSFPTDNDRYLREVYGDDYMTPPEEGSRRPAFLLLDTEHGWRENMDRAREIFSEIRS